jgi:hypothetical protein
VLIRYGGGLAGTWCLWPLYMALASVSSELDWLTPKAPGCSDKSLKYTFAIVDPG